MRRFFIVFTDLDGTLLDHDSYRYGDAAAALERLRQRGIPLVLCSSKTAAEILPLRAELGFENCPAIVENGAGLLGARANTPTPAPRQPELIAALESLPAALRDSFSNFSSWDEAELRAHTGLDAEAAGRAAKRDYSEPGLWLGGDAEREAFLAALEQLGIQAQQGGRFLTLGFDTGKAARMREVAAGYAAGQSDPVYSIAIGDAPNDIEMLDCADLGIIVPNPAHGGTPALAGESEGRIIRATRPGPAGWNQSLLSSLDMLDQAIQGN